MYRHCICFSIPLALALAVPGQEQDLDRERGSAPELRHGTFKEVTFASAALERDSTYGVFLPEGYDADENKERRYPLIIWLHGMWEDHQRFFTRGGAPVLDRMIGEGSVPELILITANGGRSSFYMNGKTGGAYEDLVTHDLLREIEANYRVRPEPALRALVGVSMGGYGALKIALKKPNLFGAVAAHSAAILPRKHEDLDRQFPWLQQWGGGQRVLGSIFGKPIDEARWASENVLTIADNLDPESISGLKIYFDCGSADRLGLDAPNAELHDVLARKNVPHHWELIDGGGHGWRSGYNQEAVERSLKFLAAAWSEVLRAPRQGADPGAVRRGG
jgi:S-formylglutathione hydrolase FrmB